MTAPVPCVIYNGAQISVVNCDNGAVEMRVANDEGTLLGIIPMDIDIAIQLGVILQNKGNYLKTLSDEPIVEQEP